MSRHLTPSAIRKMPAPTPQHALIPGVLPAARLILLDGPQGVGKTRLAAAITARTTRGTITPTHGPIPALWFSRQDSFNELAFPQLHEHHIDDTFFGSCHDANDDDDDDCCYSLNLARDDHFDAFAKALHAYRDRLVIIDEPDELYVDPKANHLNCASFWNRLHQLAKETGNCILVLRSPANRHSRTSRMLHDEGSRRSTLTLSLAWHPHDRTKRILTVTKNKRGPVGKQYLISIDGPVTWTELRDNDHAKPNLNTSPITWIKKKPGPVSKAAQVVKELLQLLTEPKPARQIQEHFLNQGIPMNSIRTALNQLNVKRKKNDDGNWWYLIEQELPATENTPAPNNNTKPTPKSPTDNTPTNPQTATLISRTSNLEDASLPLSKGEPEGVNSSTQRTFLKLEDAPNNSPDNDPPIPPPTLQESLIDPIFVS